MPEAPVDSPAVRTRRNPVKSPPAPDPGARPGLAASDPQGHAQDEANTGVRPFSGPRDLPSELVPIDSVFPYPRNPHQGDVEGVAGSLATYGQWRPIVVQQSTRYVLAGNTTWKSAKRLHWTHIWVTFVDVDDTTAKAINLADNRWGARGVDDEDAVARLLQELVDAGAWTEAIGYTSEDVDKLLAKISSTELEADDVPDLPAKGDIWVKPGDVWTIGRHRVMCGDSSQPASFDALLGPGATVGMVWTDPPYGVSYQHALTPEEAVARHRRKSGNTTIPNDDLDHDALRALLIASLTASIERLPPGRAIYCAAPSQHADVFVGTLKALGVYRQTIIWVKDTLVLGRSDYQYRHEPIHLGVTQGPFTVKGAQPIHYGWRPGAAHWFVTDRTLDTVWEIPRPKRSIEHPTMKPVELVERCILASSKRRDTVLDPFLGSGTTIVAADRTGRTGVGIELDPAYAQVSVERIANLTGERPRQIA